VAISPGVSVSYYGQLIQGGGSLSTTGMVSVTGAQVDRDTFAGGEVTLNAGSMDSGGVYINTGRFSQNGGTNRVHGALAYGPAAFNYYTLNGGLLTADSASIMPAWEGGLYLNGGLLVVTNELSVVSYGNLFWDGFKMTGGELNVSNLVINSRATFTRVAGAINQSGLLKLINGRIVAGSGVQQFGPLRLASNGGATNSVIYFPSNAADVIMGDSSAQAWASDAILTIENWQGAPFSSSGHRLIFGSNAEALTAEQLNHILFHDPPGIAQGYYSATILANGEVIPDTLPPTGRISPRMALERQADRTMRLTVRGEVGDSYSIEVSSNLTAWNAWTNQVAVNGTVTVVDTDATNHVQRFYRALLLP
jgi:hypothetical protein